MSKTMFVFSILNLSGRESLEIAVIYTDTSHILYRFCVPTQMINFAGVKGRLSVLTLQHTFTFHASSNCDNLASGVFHACLNFEATSEDYSILFRHIQQRTITLGDVCDRSKGRK